MIGWLWMTFNPEISLGTIIQVVMLLMALGALVARLSKIESKLDLMYEWFERNVVNRSHRP
jgi:hypothetical protein